MTTKFPNYVERCMVKAIRAARLSSKPKKVGAAIFDRKRMVSIGWNCSKTHPASITRYHEQHAEFNALVGTDRSLMENCTIYVARVRRLDGQLGNARPCRECREFLIAAGIKRAYYTTPTGIEFDDLTSEDDRIDCSTITYIRPGS